MAVLSLRDGSVFRIVGWGRYVSPKQRVRAEFGDDGSFSLYKQGAVFSPTLLSVPLEELRLRASTQMVRSGGGWVGGGFGALGALAGDLQARMFNAVTTRHREYAMLGVFAELADGSRRELLLGFASLSESGLRARLADALPEWTERFVAATLARLASGELVPADAPRMRIAVERAAARGLLSAGQVERLRAGVEGLAHPALPPAGNAGASSPPSPEADPVRELKMLAYLRATGVLSEDEFEAKKARLLGGR